MNNDKALDKIKKCLALAKSTNAHEAAAAMRQAQKLMAAHGLTETDISLSNVQESSARAAAASAINWDVGLARLVARTFACRVYEVRENAFGFIATFSIISSRSVKQRKYKFVGINAAAEIASYAYTVLARQCVKARLTHIQKQPKACKPATKTARGDVFALAWVDAVGDLLENFAGSESNESLIARYMENEYPFIQKVPSKNRIKGHNTNDNDWHAGAAAGRNARLQRGVNVEPEQMRLN